MSGHYGNPYGNSGVAKISGRPVEHEFQIERQGQLVRHIQAKKCPCIKNGQPSLQCVLCNAKGYILDWQTEYEVLEENSPHEGITVSPFYTPVKAVRKVQRWLHSIQGGNVFYDIAAFNATTITLVDNGELARRHEPIKATYRYELQTTVVNDPVICDGTATVKTTLTEIDTTGDTSNPYEVHGDLYSVSRVKNLTTGVTYTVAGFKKQSIYLTLGANPAPLVTDSVVADYKFTPPFRIIMGRIEIKNAISKWGEDLKQGDQECMFAGGYHVKRGNIVTPLTTVFTESALVTRGAGAFDELAQFDVFEIIGNIIDVDGVTYVLSTDFVLKNYNELTWLGSHKPAAGKGYTVVYNYHPSYMVYREEAGKNQAEDKRYPQEFLVRLFGKFTTRDLAIL
jgi:hypothetical protein